MIIIQTTLKSIPNRCEECPANEKIVFKGKKCVFDKRLHNEDKPFWCPLKKAEIVEATE